MRSTGALVALALFALTPSGSATSAPVICAVDEGADLPTPCQRPGAERVGTRGRTSVPLSVVLDGGPIQVEVHLVRASGSRRFMLTASARDPGAAEQTYQRLDDTGFERLTGDEAGNYSPKWHPSGRYLAWQQIGRRPRLWCLDHDRPDARPVAIEFTTADTDDALFGANASGVSQFDWHPTRPELYVRLTDDPRVRRVALTDCRPEVSVANELPPLNAFSLSPEGALMTYRPPKGERLVLARPGRGDIGVICGPNATDPRLEKALCRDVRWRPDGQQIAFWRSEVGVTGSQTVVLMDLGPDSTLGAVHFLDAPTTAPSGESPEARRPSLAASYAPDGARLAYVRDGRLRIVDPRSPTTSTVVGADRGRFNTNKSVPVWLDAQHLAAVVDGVGNRHPVVVAHVDPARRSTVLSRVYATHYDLAYDPRLGMLAVSAFAGQQGISRARLATRRSTGAPTPTYTLELTPSKGSPIRLSGSTGRVDLDDRLGIAIGWQAVSSTARADLILTFAPKEP